MSRALLFLLTLCGSSYAEDLQLLAYWRLDAEVLTLKDHVREANFSGYYQEYVSRPVPSTLLLDEKKSFVESEAEIKMTNANFTIIMKLRIDDTDAGYIIQWDSYYFKMAIYQTSSRYLQVVWIDKGGETVSTTSFSVLWLDFFRFTITYNREDIVILQDEKEMFRVTIKLPRTLTNTKYKFQLGQNTKSYMQYCGAYDRVLSLAERNAEVVRLDIGCPQKIYIHGMQVPGNQWSIHRQCMQGYWLELLCKFTDTSSAWAGTVLTVCDFSGIYAPDRAALPGDTVVLIGNRENATIASQSVTWYFQNGTKIANSAKYTLTTGSDLTTAHLDWIQLKIKDVSYSDEMLYIVEFNFSSGVSIKEYVKLDVMEIVLFNQIATSTTNMSFDLQVWNTSDSVVSAGWVLDDVVVDFSDTGTTVLGVTVNQWGLDNGTSVDYIFKEKADQSRRKRAGDSAVEYTVNVARVREKNGSQIIGCNITGLRTAPICSQWFDQFGICIDQDNTTEFQYNSTTTYLNISGRAGNFFVCNFTLNPNSVSTKKLQLKEIRHSAKSSVLYESGSRIIRGIFDDNYDNMTLYMNGFTADSKIGARPYFGYNHSNLYRNVTVDFVEVRGDSRGLLRQSFMGCMLHDITLSTTRAIKVQWVNRYGNIVVNNATHNYVYSLADPQWYSTNLTIDNFYQQDYTCRIYFNPLTYIELKQKAIVGWWLMFLSTFALLVLVYILAVAMVLVAKFRFYGPYKSDDQALTNVNTDYAEGLEYDTSAFYSNSTLANIRTISSDYQTSIEESQAISTSINKLGNTVGNLLERSISKSSSQSGPQEAQKLSPIYHPGISVKDKIYDFFRRSFAVPKKEVDDLAEVEDPYTTLKTSLQAQMETFRGSAYSSTESGLRQRKTSSLYDSIPAGTTARTFSSKHSARDSGRSVKEAEPVQGEPSIGSIYETPTAQTDSNIPSLRTSMRASMATTSDDRDYSYPTTEAPYSYTTTVEGAALVEGSEQPPSLLYDVIRTTTESDKTGKDPALKAVDISSDLASLKTSVRASMATTSDDRDYSYPTTEAPYSSVTYDDIKAILRDPKSSGISAKELRTKMTDKKLDISKSKTKPKKSIIKTDTSERAVSTPSRAVTYDYLTEEDLKSIISRVSDYTEINPEDSISNVPLYSGFEQLSNKMREVRTPTVSTISKSAKSRGSRPRVTTSLKSDGTLNSIYKTESAYGPLSDVSKPLSEVSKAKSAASTKSRVSFTLGVDHDDSKYSLGGTSRMKRKNKGKKASSKSSTSSKSLIKSVISKPPSVLSKPPSSTRSPSTLVPPSQRTTSTVKQQSKESKKSSSKSPSKSSGTKSKSSSVLSQSSISQLVQSTKAATSTSPDMDEQVRKTPSVKSEISNIEKTSSASKTSKTKSSASSKLSSKSKTTSSPSTQDEKSTESYTKPTAKQSTSKDVSSSSHDDAKTEASSETISERSKIATIEKLSSATKSSSSGKLSSSSKSKTETKPKMDTSLSTSDESSHNDVSDATTVMHVEDPEYDNMLDSRGEIIQSIIDETSTSKSKSKGTLSKLGSLVKTSKSSKSKTEEETSTDSSSEDDVFSEVIPKSKSEKPSSRDEMTKTEEKHVFSPINSDLTSSSQSPKNNVQTSDPLSETKSVSPSPTSSRESHKSSTASSISKKSKSSFSINGTDASPQYANIGTGIDDKQAEIHKEPKMGLGKRLMHKFKKSKPTGKAVDTKAKDEAVEEQNDESTSESERSSPTMKPEPKFKTLESFAGSVPSISTETSSSELTEDSYDDENYSSYYYSDSTVAALLKEYPGPTNFDEPLSEEYSTWSESAIKPRTRSAQTPSESTYTSSETSSESERSETDYSSSYSSRTTTEESETPSSETTPTSESSETTPTSGSSEESSLARSLRTSVVSGSTLKSLDSTVSSADSETAYSLSSGKSGLTLASSKDGTITDHSSWVRKRQNSKTESSDSASDY